MIGPHASVPKSRIELIENSSVTLYCNATAHPNILTYEWTLDDAVLREFRTNTLVLKNLNKTQSGVYSCKVSNKHGYAKSSFGIEILCKFYSLSWLSI
jgi:hypothetical protein